jgi:tRNA pseudouridine38-40 synthase
MMLKIAYLGEKFYGFARQPELRTVEGDLLKALDRIGLTPRVYPASRTDKGVSALCNVVQVGSKRDDICRILTSLLEDIWVYGYNCNDWNPRHSMKHYIYFLPGSYTEKKLQECCTLFSGAHDFSSFTKGKYHNTVKEITVSFHVKEDVTLFHFTGRSFLWEMIRRCVTGMKEYLSGGKTEQDILTALEGRSKKIPPAPPENLLLADLTCEFSFVPDEFSIKRMRKEFFSLYELHSVKKAMFKQLCTFEPFD